MSRVIARIKFPVISVDEDYKLEKRQVMRFGEIIVLKKYSWVDYYPTDEIIDGYRKLESKYCHILINEDDYQRLLRKRE